MAQDYETRAALDAAGRVLQDAPWNLGHSPASLAPHVLVVVLARLVVSLPVAQVELANDAFALQRGDGPKHRGVVGAAEFVPNLFMQLVYRPRVLVVPLKQ